jgi:hypothetical protein
MKNIKPTWFIEHPIDQEHKQYILLDFLSSVNKDIEKEDIYHPIKKIFSMIKDLSFAKSWLSGNLKDLNQDQANSIKDIYKYLKGSEFDEKEKSSLLKLIDGSLEILYKYADLGMDLWKSIESRIKIFRLHTEEGFENGIGILLCRNMATDHVTAYWWKIGETSDGSKGAIMKKVNVRNPYFSLSYEFIAHEVLDSLGLPPGFDPSVTVMEIYEDFDQESVTLKIAKELFIREISSKQQNS